MYELAMISALLLVATAPASEDRVLTLADGSELRYGLHLPDDSQPGPRPLVIGLHYAWGSGPQPPPYYGRDYMNLLVRPGLADLNAIVVAPDCPGRGWGDPRSDAAVVELVAAVRAEYDVDPERIVVTGYSMGGMGVWSFAARHADLLSAAIPMAGRPTQEIVDRWESLPVYAIHGVRDTVVPIEATRRAIEALAARGVAAELVEVPVLTHFQTAGFAEPLKAAVPWLQRVWNGAERR